VVKIQIADLNLCPRYSALVFEGVKVEPSPLWLQYRLTAIGLNPINNIVDMTNYVMAELAQPMHAFDADLLKGDTIFIRPAKPGEAFRALNDESYTLDSANLVIADSGGAIALGGVIGGAFLGIYPGLDFEMLPLAFAVVIIGGMGSLGGAAIGALAVGLADNFGKALFPEISYFTLYAPMALILAIKPTGLFGRE
jgi:phenylalanyl-tRNA synthetase beta subunit